MPLIPFPELPQKPIPHLSMDSLRSRLRTGDIVFIQSLPLPFRKISELTASWTNHVGVLVETNCNDPLVAESTFPRSRLTPISQFLQRSRNGRVAVLSLKQPLKPEEIAALRSAAHRRLGVWYDTGFNLKSSRQFCSRFVREILAESTGLELGQIETFAELHERHPAARLGFWRAWYFGRIPWNRQTVTPASLLESPLLKTKFDGTVSKRDPDPAPPPPRP